MKRLSLSFLFFAAVLCGFSVNAGAQFYSFGQDPANVRWMQLKTRNYRIIYPQGMDSLAKDIGAALQYYRVQTGEKLGFLPGQNFKKNWPVVLHPFTAYSNGVVSLQPRRMELLTTPDAYSSLSLPWLEQLVLHEGRHVAQMQYARQKKYAPFTWLTGELFSGAMAGIYCNSAILEGDAVWAETNFSFSGRGRSDAFLEYYKVAFDKDNRDFWQWMYGSQNKFTPNSYAFGYITTPVFIEEYYSRLRSRFFPFFNLQKSVKAVTGKNVREAFVDIKDSLSGVWEQNRRDRGPFLAADTLTRYERLFTEYTSEVAVGDDIFAVVGGIDKAQEIVRISPDGKKRHICSLPSIHGRLAVSTNGEICWSEHKSDIRWSLKSSSVIRKMDTDGKVSILAKGRLYNPSFSEDGSRICASEYLPEGGSRVVVLSAETGEVLERIAAPADLQVVESAWVNGKIIVSGISHSGFSIYDVSNGCAELCPPMASTIKDLSSMDGRLFFSTDLNGVFELYELASDGTLWQKTSLNHGGSAWFVSKEKVLFSALEKDGRMICSVPTDSLLSKRTQYVSPAPMPLVKGDSTTFVGNARRYSKAAHLFRFHSWAPLYVNADRVMSMSFDKISSVAYWGATAFFQNDLSTMSGSLAYKVPHEFEAKMTYNGWFPVFEASVNAGNGKAKEYFFQRDTLWSKKQDAAAVSGSLKVYIPFNFSSSGWSRGLIPQFSVELGNSVFLLKGKRTPINQMKASLRGYTMRNVPASCVYPKWGLCFEAGYLFTIGLSQLQNNYAYGYLYGYTPGLMSTHGVKWSALAYSSGNLLAQLSVDYALPFAPVDWSFLSPVAYIRNFELTCHYDFSRYRLPKNIPLNRSVVGADLAVRLSNLLWLPFPTRIGVSWRYNLNLKNTQAHNFSLLMSVDL